MKGSGTAASSSRWGRCVRAPLRVLCSVRDMYVRSMNGCVGRAHYGGAAAMGYGPNYSQFAHSYSFSSARSSAGDEDMRELIRAASARTSGSSSSSSAAALAAVRRSQSVAVGRIDEDAPCEFKDDVKVGADLLFPRSRSAAVGLNKPRMRVFA